jgi:hypothetical protein
MKSLEQEVTAALTEILHWRSGLPLLSARDIFAESNLVWLLAAEVDEAAAEAGVNVDKEASELIDTLVFLMSEVSRKGEVTQRNFFRQIEDGKLHVNGTGASPQFYDILRWRVGNLDSEINFLDEALQILNLVLSRLSMITDVPFKTLVMEVLEKNEGIRPSEKRQGCDYFSARDTDGRSPLSDDGVQRKYDYSNRLLRILRNHFGSPLEPWMHLMVTDIISNWRLMLSESEAEIERILAEFDQLLVVAILSGQFASSGSSSSTEEYHLIFERSADQQLHLKPTARMIEHGLKAAGGVVL